ncbi:activating transcription factor 3 isoform X2 [Rhynchophorus ferrugineus]|uniref:BZIP domain-containing protein n=1 Tax=Rhynchophorus ferrugineus TaxID=354439 RepID=A0A834LYF0_RHYFE|nr:hypothetical protein GWI33_021927 [Rhynchophorus ferrugineus]KAF7264916.1 hypothetical protein GWI33_021926 [Rhynchophorus ferrugineus]
MYNLNVNLAATAASAATNLLVEGSCTTPRTPEILNSLIAMTNPLDNYQFGDDAPKIVSNVPPTSTSSDSNSSSSSQVESPTGNNPPSVQHTCSQLIKAGLKLTIEQKRKQQGDGDDLLDLDSVKRLKRCHDVSENEEDKIKQEPNGLTPEDEERRRRRRERNKIAATKCRLKKRERIANLIVESETLETQNIDLKNHLQALRDQERLLRDVLSVHRPQCQNKIGPVTKESLYKLPPVSSVMEQHSYSRPAPDSPSLRNQNMEIFTRPSGASTSQHLTYTRAGYSKPPSIIVEDIGDFDSHQFINLDTMSPYSYSSSPCHNYSSNQSYGNSQEMDNGCMA